MHRHSKLRSVRLNVTLSLSLSVCTLAGTQPGGKPWPSPEVAQHSLFEEVRTTRFAAMYMVGYMGSCCRSPTTGDANTPFNKSCANSGATNPTLGVLTPHRWLDRPLLFDLSADVAQAEPLAPGSALHTQALQAVEAATAWMNASLRDRKLLSIRDGRSVLAEAECCNRSNVVCRCEELPSLPPAAL